MTLSCTKQFIFLLTASAHCAVPHSSACQCVGAEQAAAFPVLRPLGSSVQSGAVSSVCHHWQLLRPPSWVSAGVALAFCAVALLTSTKMTWQQNGGLEESIGMPDSRC